MSHKTLARDGFDVIGIETRASNADSAPIGALWGRFFGDPQMQQLDAVEDYPVALYCEYESDHTKPYTFFLGRQVAPGADVPAGLVKRHVPAGSYTLFLADGEQPAKLIETWGSVWETPLERRYDVDYEIHRSDRLVEIYVGV